MARWLYIDCDNTLVMWDAADAALSHLPKIEIDGFHLRIHETHVRILKSAHDRGDVVAVWSAAGKEWAEKVIDALGIKKHVDFCLQKPDTCIDDERTLRWLHPKPRWYRP